MGDRHLSGMATTTSRLHLTPPSRRPTDPRNPTGHWKARPPSDTGRSVIPTCNNHASQPASTGFIHLNQAARKFEVKTNTVYLRVAMMGRCSMMGAFLWWGCLTW
jgi:hypothetical protein